MFIVMTVTIPDEVLRSAQLSEAELKVELALALFQQDRLTLGQAANLAQMPQLDFQQLLGSRKIAIHYGFEQMEQDLRRVGEIALS
jgi:predicted HTH domain antitoxin